jgi:uncharacterized membrane protein YeaQ/YmgE (transglycosylase-associated protein family)
VYYFLSKNDTGNIMKAKGFGINGDVVLGVVGALIR